MISYTKTMCLISRAMTSANQTSIAYRWNLAWPDLKIAKCYSNFTLLRGFTYTHTLLILIEKVWKKPWVNIVNSFTQHKKDLWQAKWQVLGELLKLLWSVLS